MELTTSINYNFCHLHFPERGLIPFLKIQEEYPYNYLERLSYLDNADPDYLDPIIHHIEQFVLPAKKSFVFEQYQAGFVNIHPEYCEVYEQFTSNVLFRIDTLFFMSLLKKWRDFCMDCKRQQWLCVPREQVKPEYLAELDAESKQK